jgi:hypothetical protein
MTCRPLNIPTLPRSVAVSANGPVPVYNSVALVREKNIPTARPPLVESRFSRLEVPVYNYMFVQTFSMKKRCSMLQSGKSEVRFPVKLLVFSVDLILQSALWPWGRYIL